jgi:hypothetical protein
LRKNTIRSIEAKLLEIRSESKAVLEELLLNLRADGADKLSQQLGAERERLRLRAQLSSKITSMQV